MIIPIQMRHLMFQARSSMLNAWCGIHQGETAMDAPMAQANWKFVVVPRGHHDETRHSNDVVELNQHIGCRPFVCPAVNAKCNITYSIQNLQPMFQNPMYQNEPRSFLCPL